MDLTKTLNVIDLLELARSRCTPEAEPGAWREGAELLNQAADWYEENARRRASSVSSALDRAESALQREPVLARSPAELVREFVEELAEAPVEL